MTPVQKRFPITEPYLPRQPPKTGQEVMLTAHRGEFVGPISLKSLHFRKGRPTVLPCQAEKRDNTMPHFLAFFGLFIGILAQLLRF
jgi:hypothetical protein